MYCFLCDQHQNCITFAVQGLLKRGALLDMTLIAENQEIKVHKVILAACSPYFESLLSDKNNWDSIVMRNVTFEDLKLLIEYIYVGKVVVPSKQLKTFLHTAKSLQVTGFDALCDQNAHDIESSIKDRLERDEKVWLDGGDPLEQQDTLQKDTSKNDYGKLNDVIVSNIANQSMHNKRKSNADKDTISVLDPMDPLHVYQEVVIKDHATEEERMRKDKRWDRVKDLVNHYFNDKLLKGNYESSSRKRSHDSRLSSWVQKVGNYDEEGNAFLKPDTAGTEENVPNSSADDIQSLREFIYRKSIRPGEEYRNNAGAGESSYGNSLYSSSRPGSSHKKNSHFSKEEKLLYMNEGKEMLYCRYCGNAFSSKSELIIHERIHTGEIPFTCHHCGKRFSRMEALILHGSIHSGDKPFKCLHCGEQFSQKNALVTHLKNHLGEKLFRCKVCGEQFLKEATLLRHQLVHQQKLHKCQLCGKTFSDRKYLTLHLRAHFDSF